MGIQINGNNDIISALDGSWTAEGASINTSGILTATTFKGNIVGTAATFTGPVTIGGTLTYEDVTNIDSIGIITARSTVSIGDSINHIGDTDTAIRFPSANTISAETAGSERIRINSLGQVGINQTTWTNKDHMFEVAQSTQDKEIARFTNLGGVSGSVKGKGFIGLSVFNGTTYPHVSIGVEENNVATHKGALTVATRNVSSDSAPEERLRILSNGRIGIGTDTAPRDMVHIHNSTANASSYIQFTNANTAGTGINDGTLIGISQNNSNTDGTGSGFTILQKENAEITLGTNNEERMRIDASGWCMLNTSTLGSSKTAKELIVSYNDTGISGGDKGRAGITIRSGQNDSSVSQPGYIYFSDGTSGTNESIGSIKYDHNDDNMNFATGGYEALRITDDGELRINFTKGTNNVPAKLRLHCGDTSISASQAIGEIRFAGRDSGGVDVSRTGALIQATAAGTWDTGQSAGYAASHLDFFTQNNSGTDTVAAGARLRINSDGHVIIGGTSWGAAGSMSIASYGGFRSILASGQAQDSLIGAISGVSNGFQVNTTSLNAQTYTFHNGSTVALRITSAGKVGIGQDTPTEIFHIKQNDAVGPSITLENNNSGDKCWINNWGSTGGGSGRQNKFEINASAVSSLALASAYISLQAGGAGDSYERVRITTTALLPGTDNNLNLGSSSKRWQNIYTGDLQLSNVTPSVSANGEELTPSGNEVDGTEGTWTIQEGLNDLFLINRINGKKYKFNLTEIS